MQAQCHNDKDKQNCCTKRESCENFQGKCSEGTALWDGGLCEHESCTTSVTDKSLCCQPLFGQELEGLLIIENAGYSKIVDTDNQGTVESLVSASIAKHIGCHADKVEVAVSTSMLGGTNCDFVIDTNGLNEKGVADMRTKFQNKVPLMTSLDREIAKLAEIQVNPEEEMKVAFVLLSDAMIDAAHGGIYIRGKLVEQDGDDWSVMLPGGFVEHGFAEHSLHNIDDNSDYIGVDVYVDALTRLFRVAELIEQGSIDADLNDWVPLPEFSVATNSSRNSFGPVGHIVGGGKNVFVIVLIILLVIAVLGGVAYLLYARSKKPDDEARGLLQS